MKTVTHKLMLTFVKNFQLVSHLELSGATSQSNDTSTEEQYNILGTIFFIWFYLETRLVNVNNFD